MTLFAGMGGIIPFQEDPARVMVILGPPLGLPRVVSRIDGDP